MGLTVAHLAAALARAHAAMCDLEQVLNVADAKLGDGDTGSMLARVFERLAGVDLAQQTDVGAAFRSLATASVAATGSSLGTLFGAALMAISRETKETADVPWSRVASLLTVAGDAIAARGGAKLGDKTVLDVLDAVAGATTKLNAPGAIATAAARAGRETLDRFRPQPCAVGRARMYADKSIGLDDPGMLAFVRLSEVLVND